MNDQEKKIEVGTQKKVNIGVQIGIGIAVLAIVTTGAGLGAYLAAGGASKGIVEEVVQSTKKFESADFVITSPTSGSTNDIDVAITWTSVRDASQYKVYLSKKGTLSTPVATVSGNYYLAEGLDASSTYITKVEALNKEAITLDTTPVVDFNTMGWAWVEEDGLKTDEGCSQSACGGNRACYNHPDNPGNPPDPYELTCDEFVAVVGICSGYSNQCPDSQFDRCIQQTLCQCKGLACGGPECDEYLQTLSDPCL